MYLCLFIVAQANEESTGRVIEKREKNVGYMMCTCTPLRRVLFVYPGTECMTGVVPHGQSAWLRTAQCWRAPHHFHRPAWKALVVGDPIVTCLRV